MSPLTDASVDLAGRRRLALSATVGALLQLLPSWTGSVRADEPIARVEVNTSLAPDQSRYDPSDEKLRDAAQMLQKALDASDVKAGLAVSQSAPVAILASFVPYSAHVQEEERLFTQLIDKYKGTDAPWSADVVGRALGNRGNARSRQGMFDAAIVDYNESMKLCPWSVDPMLNR